MIQLAILQHVWWEGPGKFLLEAASRCNAKLNVIKVWQQQIPELSAYDGLIILGGGPDVGQEGESPYLDPEKEAIRGWLQSDKPCLGICLGHLLLAEVLGSRIGPNFCHSIGFTEGHLTSIGRAHPIFKGIDTHLPLFKWHAYAILPPVPSHLHILATSKECQVEAFTVQNRPYIIGIQFDSHAAAPEDVAGWLNHDAAWLNAIPDKIINTKQIMADAGKYSRQTRCHFLQFFKNFIRLIQNPG